MNKLQNKFRNSGKIAVVRTDRLGDMVLTLPMCAAIKEFVPNCKLTMIAQSYTKPILINNGIVDSTIFIDEYSNGIKDIFKQNKFDAVFFPRPRFDECLAGFMARIPIRIGSGYRWYSLLFNHRVHEHRKTADYHEAEYNVRLVASIAGRDFDTRLIKPYITPETKKIVHDFLDSLGADFANDPIIIHPGSGGSSVEYPAEKYGLAANLISEKYQLPVVITGVESEMDQCNIVHSHCPLAVNLCGKLNLERMIALIDGSRLLVAGSTGVLHIAAALGTSVVGLYPNSPQISAKRWGPYLANSAALLPPASEDEELNDDVSLIEIDRIVEAVGRLI